MESFDIIIVGAGPAGLKCAETLGGSGLSILLTEKKTVIGPKVCAGGLTGLCSSLEFPSDKTLEFTTQQVILNGEEHQIILKNPLRTISRQDLGICQLALAKQYPNIEIRVGTVVSALGENYILLKAGEKIHFKYLVGADGSTSMVRKYLGLGNDIYMGMQYIIPSVYDKPVWFLNTPVLGTGYGWIFPHRTFTSAGVFFNPRRLPSAEAKKALDRFLDEYGLDYSKEQFQSAPVNCRYGGVKFGNIYLVGDAAGMASACTGEGISYALTSGDDVARHILDSRYDFDNLKKVIRYKKRQEFVLNVFDRLPWLTSLLFRGFIAALKRSAVQGYFGY